MGAQVRASNQFGLACASWFSERVGYSFAEWIITHIDFTASSTTSLSFHSFNHAGVLNAMNWMYGTMGIANAQRSLDIVRTIAEFISQPQYRDVVTMFGLVNEPQLYQLGQDVVGHL